MALSHVEDGSMLRKRHTPEEIVTKLRQVEVLTAQGRPVAEAIRSIGVTEVAPGRTARRGDLLHAQGSPDHHRGLATALQHPSTALVPRLRATSSRGPGVAGCASPASSAGHTSRRLEADNALTFNPDHFMGSSRSLVESALP